MGKRYMYTWIAVVMLWPAPGVLAQEQPSLRQRADQLFQRFEYANAAVIYLKLADNRNPRLQDLERLAECYRMMNDYESAENWYARVIQQEESGAGNLLRYGEVLKANGKYEAARRQLEAYAGATGDRDVVALQLAGCDSAIIWMANPTPHKLRNERGVNTEYAEFSVFPMGDRMAYVGEPDIQMDGQHRYGRTGNPYLRVYTTERVSDNGLENGVIAESSVNSGAYHVGPAASPDGGQTLYVTRTYPDKATGAEREGKYLFRTNRLELHVLTRTDGAWLSEPFAYNKVEAYSVGHAAFDSDGRSMYFASDMPGGYGGADIWHCVKQADGNWGIPVNCGPAINSAGDELFPNIGPDGTLYYSSDGFAGMGGLDIFQATGKASIWNKPVNMRYPVNSSGDDFAFVVNTESEAGLSGYLSSNRKGGVGSDDIFSFSFRKPRTIIILKGTTFNKSTGETLPAATVTLYDGKREIVARRTSDKSGRFEFTLDTALNYTVMGQRQGYHADSAAVSTEGIMRSDTLEVALFLDPVFEQGKTFTLENIYYDFDKHNIRRDAAEVLDELVRTLRDNPTLKIELSSHTDSRGSDGYNLALSKRRAQAAVGYLVSRGIARDRMVARGYGETHLLNRCSNGVPCSHIEHQANRRTEVTVLEYFKK